MKVLINTRMIIKVFGYIMIIIGVSMFPVVLAAIIFNEHNEIGAFTLTALLTCLAGILMVIFSRPQSRLLKTRDGYVIVGFAWVVASLVGTLPYLISGYLTSFCSAFFEATAGFTTTGATVLNIDTMPQSIMLWKAITHWLGGIGILVFTVSILPALSAGGNKLYKAEVTTLNTDFISNRISYNSKRLYVIYFSFTIAVFILLCFSVMTPWEALINALGCISTGGIMAQPDSISYFDSTYIGVVLTVFTLLASINFNLYTFATYKRFNRIKEDSELRAYAGILAVGTVLTAFALKFFGVYDSIASCIKYAFFQVVAFSTTSGYAVVDYSKWPSTCVSVLLILMIIGGCSSSTAGSLKVARFVVAWRILKRGIYARIHPSAVTSIRISRQPLPNDVLSQITSYIFTFFFILLGGTFILSLQGYNFITNFSACLGMLSNTGISFGDIGTSGNYRMFSEPLQFVLSILMICGRLEIFTFLLLFMPSFWRPDKRAAE